MDFHREHYAILERFLDDPRTTNMIYAHHTSIHQAVIVKRGQIIAKSGQTGEVGSPQLHFEIRKGSSAVDPLQFLNGA